LIKSILTLRENKAVSLSIHGFRSQSGSNQKDIFGGKLLQRFWEVEQLEFDTNVLLGSNTFTLRSIMISARLLI